MRLLAKLYHGEAATVPAKFYCAVMSAIWEAGYNPPLQKILHDIIEYMVDTSDAQQTWMKYVEKYVHRSPALAGASVSYIPTIYDVVNADASLLKPLVNVVNSIRCKRAGTRPAWYKNL